MKNKRYILMTKLRSKYNEYYKINFKLFDNYFELQKHLMHFWYMKSNTYKIFVETDLRKDYSLNDIKKGAR